MKPMLPFPLCVSPAQSKTFFRLNLLYKGGSRCDAEIT